MDAAEFWALIDRLRARSEEGIYHLVDLVREHLADLPASEVLAYHRRFVIENHRAYRPDLFEAAILAGVAGGDDSFTDFRSWLIAQGRETYERVVAEPDELATLDWDEDLVEFTAAEALGAAGSVAYEDATGTSVPEGDPILELPESADAGSGVPSGNPAAAWEPYDDAALQRTFPRLWARFG